MLQVLKTQGAVQGTVLENNGLRVFNSWHSPSSPTLHVQSTTKYSTLLYRVPSRVSSFVCNTVQYAFVSVDLYSMCHCFGRNRVHFSGLHPTAKRTRYRTAAQRIENYTIDSKVLYTTVKYSTAQYRVFHSLVHFNWALKFCMLCISGTEHLVGRCRTVFQEFATRFLMLGQVDIVMKLNYGANTFHSRGPLPLPLPLPHWAFMSE